MCWICLTGVIGADGTNIPSVVYYHYDGLGSVTHLTDASGAVVERYTYDVFGQPTILSSSNTVLASSGVGNRFMFTGREYLVGIDLYDYRNRVYSPVLGRFLQMDPIKLEAGDVNLYEYVGNSPVIGIDPLGLCKCGVDGDIKFISKGWTIDAHNAFFNFNIKIQYKSGGDYKPSCCRYIQKLQGANSRGSTTDGGTPLAGCCKSHVFAKQLKIESVMPTTYEHRFS